MSYVIKTVEKEIEINSTRLIEAQIKLLCNNANVNQKQFLPDSNPETNTRLNWEIKQRKLVDRKMQGILNTLRSVENCLGKISMDDEEIEHERAQTEMHYQARISAIRDIEKRTITE
tara:strand:+ start:292 stop:642 length:351 start_codon:yes stop_codon:yes gene_type:complete